jgi:hypothetical protein
MLQAIDAGAFAYRHAFGFGKLGISSRRQLAGAPAGRTGDRDAVWHVGSASGAR